MASITQITEFALHGNQTQGILVVKTTMLKSTQTIHPELKISVMLLLNP